MSYWTFFLCGVKEFISDLFHRKKRSLFSTLIVCISTKLDSPSLQLTSC